MIMAAVIIIANNFFEKPEYNFGMILKNIM